MNAKKEHPIGMFLFGAADRIESIKVLPPSRPAASGCPPDTRIFDRSSPVSLNAKRNIPSGCSFFGAADRTRTGTESPPADFKSAVSTIPPQRRGLPNYFSIVSDCRQVGRTALPPPIRSGDWPGKTEGSAETTTVIARPQAVANRSLSGSFGTGRCFASQGIRIATALRASQ